MTFDLDRFKQAQARDFDAALAELRSGQKRSHWIWYVFPQLSGLGRSPMAEAYGMRGIDEAVAYLRDPELRSRLIEVMSAVRAHAAAPLRLLMGSEIDALKLVSSMTLFREAARRAKDEDVETLASEILRTAAAQGYAECGFTLRACAR